MARTCSAGATVTGYHPNTLAELGDRLALPPDAKVRWKHVWEFLEEYRWEQAEAQPLLLQVEPAPVGDERWDALLAALGEHLAARLDLALPPWAESRVLRRPWFPAELQVQRAEALPPSELARPAPLVPRRSLRREPMRRNRAGRSRSRSWRREASKVVITTQVSRCSDNEP
jgi:hypothetical protein